MDFGVEEDFEVKMRVFGACGEEFFF